MMLPVNVCFDDLTSRIQMDDKQQPCLNLCLNLSLPIAAIINALSHFQRQHVGDKSMSATATPYQPRQPRAAVGGLTAATGEEKARPSRGASESGISVNCNEVASEIASTLRGAAPAQQLLREEAMEPTSAFFKNDGYVPGYGPPPGLEKPIPRSKGESPTWDTPISKLHDVYEEVRKRTTWVSKSGSADGEDKKEANWVLDDEACLLNFEPVPLSAPSFGRGDKRDMMDDDAMDGAPMFR